MLYVTQRKPDKHGEFRFAHYYCYDGALILARLVN
jgi:hypothetical protein